MFCLALKLDGNVPFLYVKSQLSTPTFTPTN